MKLHDFLKCRKVKCVESRGRSLTVGKIYTILSVVVPLRKIKVENDTGANVEYDIHCFEPVIESAENPIQNAELTPEFEAVEPKFEVGDKVYVGLTGKIARVTKIIDDDVVNVANKNNEVRAWVSNICHANPENYERLQATFPDIEFERPPLTGNELCRKLLDKGEKYIMAKDDTDTWRIICDYCDDWFTDVVSGKCLKNVNPVNSKGEPLTEAVLDE